MKIAESELILNSDGSIYHLNLLPEQLAPTIITVGDPDRVEEVTKYFDTIDCIVRKREFHTQTGSYKGKKISVISTGIGTDNIDIVLNELDALVNLDLNTRTKKATVEPLTIIRIGTSGAIQPSIPVDSFIASGYGIGFDSLLHFYDSKHVQNQSLSQALQTHLDWAQDKSSPYAVAADQELLSHFIDDTIQQGVTITNVGFYGPQGRVLRLPLQDASLNDKITSFTDNNLKITNLEMETAGIYGLSKLLGHKAISLNAIVANRATGDFSKDSTKTIDRLIRYALDKIALL
ncbi:nucleoside phosphorylase [Aquimarina intermedia]|uniref:Uridine phosphorylase n=1 Tax=Aquimarina intermedia TaxID=350814 RepID=A0A5S5C6U3_9FLAO|nr:nucleoside phosphorylase [Aquimarina intermedia]TYP75135.1 uridine phosphorylase [Aquimarina intermedia]